MRLLSLVVAALLVGCVTADARQWGGGAAVLEATKGSAAIGRVVSYVATADPIACG